MCNINFATWYMLLLVGSGFVSSKPVPRPDNDFASGFDAPVSPLFPMNAAQTPPSLLFGNSFDDNGGASSNAAASTNTNGGEGSGKNARGVDGSSGSGGGVGGGGNGSKKLVGSKAADDLNLGFGINGNDFIGELTAGANNLLKQNAGSLSSSSGLTDAVEITPGDLQHQSEINSGIVISTGIGIGGGPLNNNYAQGQSTALSAGKNTAASGSGSGKSNGKTVSTNAAGQVVINRPDSGRQSTVFATNYNNAASIGNSNANSNSLSFVGDNLQKEFDGTKQQQAQQEQLKFDGFSPLAQVPNAFGQPNRGIVGNHAQSVLNTLPRGQQNAFNAITGFNRASVGNNNKNRRNTEHRRPEPPRNRPGQSDFVGQNVTTAPASSHTTPTPVATVATTVLTTTLSPFSSTIGKLQLSNSDSSISNNTSTPLPTTTVNTTPAITSTATTLRPEAPMNGGAQMSNDDDRQHGRAQQQQAGGTALDGTSAGMSQTGSTTPVQHDATVASNTGNALINSAAPARLVESPASDSREFNNNNNDASYSDRHGNEGDWNNEHRYGGRFDEHSHGRHHHRHDWHHHRRPSFDRRREEEGDDRHDDRRDDFHHRFDNNMRRDYYN